MRAVDIVRKLCPRANANYIAAFERGDKEMEDSGINTPLRLAHFLAQVCHETGGLTILEENMRYTAARIRQVWPSRPEAVKFANNPEGLANNVYANRMGNGDAASGDGWRFRGRGLLQTTGRYSYKRFGFEKTPDLIATDPAFMLRPALMEWVKGGCNEKADRNAIKEITKTINGGLIGYDDRVAWFNRIWKLIGEAPSWQTAQPDPDVTSVQIDLAALGYETLIDGRKGPKTVAAIMAFQRSVGIPADGVAGPVTRAAIKAKLDEAQEGKAPKEPTADVPAVPSATPLGLMSTAAGGGLDQVADQVLSHGQSLQGMAAYVPIIGYIAGGLIVVGVGLTVYGVARPLLKKRLGAPS